MADENSISSSTPNKSSPKKYQEGEPVKPDLVHVIINPAAGQERPMLGILNRIFRDHQIKWEAFVTQERGDAHRYAQESAGAGADVVMVCGGDGTVMEAASGLHGTGVPLAIAPCGTANVMSIELSIPADFRQAVELVVSGENTLRGVDMGRVNDYHFLLRVGTGMEAKMIIDTPRETKNRWGNLAYLFTGLSQLQRLDVADYTLSLDGMHVEVEGISLMIANSANVGLPGVNLVQDASISDGLLDVILIRRVNLPDMVAIATNSLLNLPDDPEPLLHWQAREVRVESAPSQPVQVDGEPIPDTILTAQVSPKAVDIICPIPVTSQPGQ